MFKFRLLFLACTVLAINSYAVETKFWQQTDQTDFEKGTLNKLSLRSDGRLYLAPAFSEIFDSSTPYLWTVAAGSNGTIFAAGGGSGNGKAKLFEIDSKGKSRTLAELDGIEIHAVVLGKDGQVYAATNPDGKVYQISSDGKSRVFYDPKAKYIWALAFDSKGNLYVATGDQGEIHRVTPDGKGSVFFKTEETHARSLAIDSHDNLIAGTEPGGLIIRVSPAGAGFVLYQAPKREITAVAIGKDNDIYAAGVGNRSSSAPSVNTPPPSPAPPASTTPPAPGAPNPRTATTPPALSGPPSVITGGSEVYRIASDGSPRKEWSSSQDIVYAIGFDRAGHPLLGTGNRGKIYRLDDRAVNTLLIDASPTQITGFAAGPQGKLYAITGNIGKVYEIGPGIASQGTFESDVFDANAFTWWGRLSFRGSAANSAIFTRSGNVNHPQNNWSAWAAVQLEGDNGRINSPAARFLQYKIELRPSSAIPSPEILSVEVAYLTKNVAPTIDEIEITPPNYKFPPQSLTLTPSQTITLPALGQHRRSSSGGGIDLGGSQTLSYGKGYLGARWNASDENGDTLCYKVEIRGTKESTWKLLKDKLHEKYAGWDTASFPDGEYQLRVTASDSPSNPPGESLSASLTSDPFLIDNTAPLITGLAATASGKQIDVKWKAHDASSLIDKAEYSLDGGEWMIAPPTTKLSDAQDLEYRVTIDVPAAGEHTIAVRVTDAYDNQSAEKVIVK